jgi:hypothetical protein
MYGIIQSRTYVRWGDPLGLLLFNLAINIPLRNIGERCREPPGIHALSDNGNYMIITPFVPTNITIAIEALGKVSSDVQPIIVHGTP